MAEREPGYYWVRLKYHHKHFEVGKWDRFFWRVAGYSAMSDEALNAIGPRIYPPGEDPVRNELVAALSELLGATVFLVADYPNHPISPMVLDKCNKARAALAKADAR